MSTTPSKSPDNIFGPVDKLKWLALAAADGNLSRAELAVLITLADMMNATTGLAWPSYATLAERAGIKRRHVSRVISDLTERGQVVIVTPGDRVKSNRYTINMAYYSPGIGSDAHDTTLVSPMSRGSDMGVPDVVTPMSPESIHSSEHQAKDEMNRSQAEAGTAARRPVGASASAGRRGGERFPEFWTLWPKRTSVAATEDAIDRAMADGAAYADILAGAERFIHYCDATGKPPQMQPSDFVRLDKYLDGWEPPSPRAPPGAKEPKRKTSAKAKTNGNAETEAKPSKRKNPAFKEWEKIHDIFSQKEIAANVRITNHLRSCPTCKAVCQARNYDEICAEGKRLASEGRKARESENEWLASNKKPERWLYSE